MDESSKPREFTPDQLKFVKKLQIYLAPVRIIVSLMFYSLAAGGPLRFFAALPAKVFSILFSAVLMIESIVQAPDVGGKEKDRNSFFIGRAAFSATCFLIIVDWFWIRKHWAPLEWSWVWVVAGAAITLAGETIRVVSIRTLGRFFTRKVRLHSNQKVIRAGIYSRVRHPSYAGLMTVLLGHITVFASAIGYALFVVAVIPTMLNRIRVEEIAMREELGEEYDAYRRETRKLIPFVY